jgi:small subunit ribosomal protein S13
MAASVRIAGVEIPSEKRVVVALTYVRGLGRSLSRKIPKTAKVSEETRVKDLKEDEVKRIRAEVESRNYLLEGELRQKVASDIRLLKEMKCYRGNRHKLGLPVRNQQTRTNARTRKGKGLAVGGLKRKLEKK